MTRSKQAGFSIVEAVLAVAVLGVIGVAGWLVYQHNLPKVSDAAGNTNQTTNQQTTTTPAPTVAYLTVKEWGVKLPLSDTIKDAYYVVGTSFSNSPDGLPSGIFLGLKSLTAPTCNPANNNVGSDGAIGAILRFLPTDTDAVTGQPLTQEYPNGVTIGNYYYGYQSRAKNNPCTQTSSVQAADTAFAAAAKGTASAAAN